MHLGWHRVRHAKRRYENINDGYQEYSNDCKIIDFVSTTNLLFVLDVVSAVQDEANSNGDLKSREY